MTILQINKFYYIQGGADRHFFDLMDLLKSYGHKVIPFSMQSPKNLGSYYSKYFVSNIDLSQAKFSFSAFKKIGRIIYSLEAQRKIKELILKEKPDLAHIHNIYHQISPSILGVLKKHNIPIVMTVHDYKLICPNYKLFCRGKICEKCKPRKTFGLLRGKKKKYYQAVFQKCIKNSYCASGINCLEMYLHKIWGFYEKYVGVFICPSNFLRNKLAEWGLPKEKLITLPHPFKTTENHISPSSGNYVLYFGRLSAEKGLDLLISTAAELPQIKFKIVGEGPEKKMLLTLIKKNKISNLEFLGYKKGQELQKIIQGSYLVVVPSAWQEIFGLVILEAFSWGKTVIARKRGGIPELIQEGETGFLFQTKKELKEKIKFLFQNPKICQKIGRRAQAQLKRYNPEIYYQKLINIYQTLNPRIKG